MRVHKHTRTATAMCLRQFCFGAKSKCSTLIMKFSLTQKGQPPLLPELHPVHKCHWKRSIQPVGFKKSTVELTLTAGPPEDALTRDTWLYWAHSPTPALIALSFLTSECSSNRWGSTHCAPKDSCTHPHEKSKQTLKRGKHYICHHHSFRKRKEENKSTSLHVFLCNLMPLRIFLILLQASNYLYLLIDVPVNRSVFHQHSSLYCWLGLHCHWHWYENGW